MESKSALKKIQELRQEISRHNDLYYNKGRSAVSDAEYDSLVEKLRELEKQHPEHLSEDSPTRRVGAPIPSKLRKVRHTSAMLSLESVSDEEGARRFDASVRKGLESFSGYSCEPKLDGLSVELVYENGVFSRGSTRGDGITGEDITSNLSVAAGVPKKLKGSNVPEKLSVRGEALMLIREFQRLNKTRLEQGREAYANPRNVAAGSLRQLDAGVAAERKLEVYCYRVLDVSGKMPSTQDEALDLMRQLGLQVVPMAEFCAGIDEAVEYHHRVEKERDALDYEMDGVVIKVNDISSQEKLGVRATNPRWAVAYKFRPRREITKVEDIVVQVGRTGVVTPLALLKPVDVGGVTVARASLHNMDRIEKLGIKIGDTVKVERAGDVIPYVSEVMARERTGEERNFRMPSKCPSCGSVLEKEDVFYRCPAGLTCPAQIKEAICHYSAKNAADIEGLSDKSVELLYEKGIVKSISDIYALNKERLMELEGWKQKKADNLMRAIEGSKDIQLDRFIYALGIRNVGRHIAGVLAEHYSSLEDLSRAGVEELMAIREIGPETARYINEFLSSPRNREEIKTLLSRGVKISEVRKDFSGALAGKKIVFTGSLSSMTRAEARSIAESRGARVLSGVTSDTDLVVAGPGSGSKRDKAEKLGIEVIDESSFTEMAG